MLHVPDVTTATEQQEEGRVAGEGEGEREMKVEGERVSKTKTKERREGGQEGRKPSPDQPAIASQPPHLSSFQITTLCPLTLLPSVP